MPLLFVFSTTGSGQGFDYICPVMRIRFNILSGFACSFFCFGLLFTACDSNSGQQQQDEEATQDSTSFYGTASIKLPRINAAATPIVNDWSIFDDFEDELIAMNTLSLAEIRSRSERLVSFSDSLANTVPDTLGEQSIRSRVNVLQTRVKLLNQAINSERPKAEAISTCFEELNTSMANLKVRINEKILKDRIDLDRKESEEAEREKQKAILDSIIAAENQR